MAVVPALVACGGQASRGAAEAPEAAAAGGDDAGAVEPLGVGADYRSYQKVTSEPHLSKTHGGRFVETWVNDVGAEAYRSGAPIPVGTVIVKESWEAGGDRPSDTRGPIFVMEKRADGYDDAREDWYFAIHWAEPTPAFRERYGGGIYWQSPSPRVNYCWDCHENYDRELGLPPSEARAW